MIETLQILGIVFIIYVFVSSIILIKRNHDRAAYIEYLENALTDKIIDNYRLKSRIFWIEHSKDKTTMKGGSNGTKRS